MALTMRERDPAARRLLAELLRLEGLPWPAVRPAYSGLLIALADRCSTKSAKAEVYRWAHHQIGGVLVDRDERRRECLVDALHEAVAIAPSILLRFRTGLDRGRRPNIRSMLAAWITWRAGDFFEARYRRHRRHADAVVAHWSAQRPTPTPEVTANAREIVLCLWRDGDPAGRGLLLHGIGHSVADAARRSGSSRQQIYRRRNQLRTEP